LVAFHVPRSLPLWSRRRGAPPPAPSGDCRKPLAPALA
jgi:hypothetical protein